MALLPLPFLPATILDCVLNSTARLPWHMKLRKWTPKILPLRVSLHRILCISVEAMLLSSSASFDDSSTYIGNNGTTVISLWFRHQLAFARKVTVNQSPCFSSNSIELLYRISIWQQRYLVYNCCKGFIAFILSIISSDLFVYIISFTYIHLFRLGCSSMLFWRRRRPRIRTVGISSFTHCYARNLPLVNRRFESTRNGETRRYNQYSHQFKF